MPTVYLAESEVALINGKVSQIQGVAYDSKTEKLGYFQGNGLLSSSRHLVGPENILTDFCRHFIIEGMYLPEF